MRIPPQEAAYFVQRLLVFFSSCDARRYRQWERTSWADFTSSRAVLTRGRSLVERAMVIPLRGKRVESDPTAWNMIGDPYPFDVPFNALLLDTLAEQAGDPALSINGFDAAVLAQRSREQMAAADEPAASEFRDEAPSE